MKAIWHPPSLGAGSPTAARILLAATYASAVGVLAVLSPTAATALAFGPAAVYLLVRSALARLMFFVLGAILTLGVTSEVGTGKYVYAGGVALATILSSASLSRSRPDWRRTLRPLLYSALICSVVIAAGFLASPSPNTEAAVRLGTLYLLVLVAPIIGIDAGAHVGLRTLIRATLVIGSFSAVAYSVDWTSRRGVAALALDSFAASSLYLPTLSLALAVIIVLADTPLRERRWWPALVLIPLALLFSGNRTAYLVPVAGLALLGRRGSGKVTFSRGAAAVLGVCGTLALIVPFLAQPVLRDPEFVARRIASIFGAAVGGLTSDLSYQMRARQYEYATSAISESPLWGNGVHFGFGVSIDNVLATPARIGWLGAAAFVVFISLTYATGRRLSGRQASAFTRAYLGTLLVVVATAPLTSPIDDRGFAAMIALAAAGTAAAARDDGREKHEGAAVPEASLARSTSGR